MQTALFDFTGRVVLITGASRGLGKAMALGFARNGASVIVASRKAEACEDVVGEIRASGGEAVAIPVHVGKWDALEPFIERAASAFGRLDTLVNNAGIAPVSDGSLAMGEALFDKIVAVNIRGRSASPRWPSRTCARRADRSST